MNKKLISLMLIFVLSLSILSGCTNKENASSNDDDTTVEDEETVRVALLLGNLGDNGFNDEVYQGVNEAKEKLGIEFDYAEVIENSEIETQLRMFADAESYDLIIASNANYIEPLKSVAANYPDQKFTLADGTIEGLDNVHSIRAFDPEQHFLSGVLAGLVTKDERMPLANEKNIIGFIGGMDTPISRSGAAGFMAGAKYVNPDIEIIYNIVGDYRDPGTAKEIAMTAYGRGADIISHNAGGSGMGVFDAAEEVDKYVIGSSMSTIDPERSLVTSVKRIDLLLYQEIENIVNGTWEPGVTIKGIEDGVCDYDRTGINTEIPEDLFEKVEEIRQYYLDGKFEIPEDPDEIDEWTKNNTYEKSK